ncbi:MAG: NAD(P)/FAD-dependent oxidoreductase [Sphingomonas sp.]
MHPSSRPSTAIVIGNGVVGLTSAIALQRRGWAVSLVAPDEPWRGASWGNAGHIAVEQIEPLASPGMLRTLPRRLSCFGGPAAFPWRDVRHWLPFSLRLLGASTPDRFRRGTAALRGMLATAIAAWQRLLQDAGAADLLRLDGHFIVWENAASAARGTQRWLNADIGTATARRATASELADLQALSKALLAGAIRIDGSGQIVDMTILGRALAHHFVDIGGNRVAGRAVRITPGPSMPAVVTETGEQLSADRVVVAAGAASRDLLTPLGLAAPMIAERGYHIQTTNTAWPADMPPVVFEDRAMIVTRFASALRAASFVEFSHPDSPADPRKWARLRAHVAALGLSFDEPVEQWIGARPTLPDYLPAIGVDRAHPWLVYAFGHQHLGLTLAATSGEAVGALVAGEAPYTDITPFSLDRFGR